MVRCIISKCLGGKAAAVLGLLSVFAASCNKVDSGDAVALERIREIVFTADVAESSLTKATPVVSLTDFRVSATQGSAGSETSAWNDVAFALDHGFYVGNKFWPEDMDPVYHFYASNSHIDFAAGGSTVDVDNSTDVVCAYLATSTYMSSNALAFEHVFARLGDVNITAAAGYTISGVSFRLTPYVGGTYNMRTGSGRTDRTGWSGLDSGSETNIAPLGAGTKANDIFAVPGDYVLSCSWTATEDDYSKSFNKDVDIRLVGGKVNTLNVTLGGDVSQIILGVSLAEWSDKPVDAGTFPII